MTTVAHHFPSAFVETAGPIAGLRSVAFRIDGRRGKWHLQWSPDGKPCTQHPDGPVTTDLFGWFVELPATLGPIDPLIDVVIGDVIEIDEVGSFLICEPAQAWSQRATLIAAPGNTAALTIPYEPAGR